ncbi:MAG: hypothetical protein LBC93_06185, partial [Synergistaceae bacterium]|nr:hypothetical protein [Synergistaceae bacterium]
MPPGTITRPFPLMNKIIFLSKRNMTPNGVIAYFIKIQCICGKRGRVEEALINGVLWGQRPISGGWGGAPQGVNQRFLDTIRRVKKITFLPDRPFKPLSNSTPYIIDTIKKSNIYI